MDALAVLGGWAARPVGAASSQPAGAGTQTDPYVITTVEELQWIQNDPGAHCVLGNDIDASATADWNGGAGFDPLGRGSLDGQGYTIDGLVINRPTEDHVGLFASGASIQSVHLTDVDISGGSDVGGLIGSDWLGRVSESSAQGKVAGDERVGGLIGSVDESRVTECSARGSVMGTKYVGGVIGMLTYSLLCGSSARGNVRGDERRRSVGINQAAIIRETCS